VKTAARSRRTRAKTDWVEKAKDALIKDGIKGVKVDLLARDLGVTRGSFYWHFRNRQSLLDALLDHWRHSNSEPMLEAIRRAGARRLKEDFRYVDDLWLEERDYLPGYDAAVRNWARTERTVGEAVRQVDQIRIDAFTEMFKAYGFKGEKALIRARILYYHQVGYYALNIHETVKERRYLSPLYDEVLLF